MTKVSLSKLVQHCDTLLKTGTIKDYDKAANGLQVENNGTVSRIAAAVDASLATVRMASGAGANLLIVHHGLFWSPSHPWTGKRYELIQELVKNNLAIYSSHLPLDAHRTIGNNVRLCAALGLRDIEPFFFDRGQFLGFRSEATISREDLKGRLAKAVGGKVITIPGGPRICRKIGVVTGGAGSELKKGGRRGGGYLHYRGGPHWTYALAEECGINLLYGGHYATETFGVKALAAHLSKRFKVPWTFIDHPTGL